MTYAKILTQSTISTTPPRVIGKIANPPADLLAENGWLPLVEADPPTPAAGFHLVASYALEDGRIVQSWAQEADPPRNLSLSKRKLMVNLREAGLWPSVKAWIAASGYGDDWDCATTLDEQDPMLQTALAAMREALGLSPDAIEALLVNSAAD